MLEAVWRRGSAWSSPSPGSTGTTVARRSSPARLRDAGMEVIYTGLHQTPEQIVETAIQEDADAVGISILSGAHMTLVPRILEGLKAADLADVLVIVGGTIPRRGRRRAAAPGRGRDLHAGHVHDRDRRLPPRARGLRRLMSIDVRRDGRVALLTINRPEVLNALSTEILEELYSEVTDLARDNSVGAIVLTGAGDRAFIAGADIAELADEDAARGPRLRRARPGHRAPPRDDAQADDRRGQRLRARRRLRDGAGLRHPALLRERRASASPRSTSGSCPAGAAPSGSRARPRSASPRRSC